MVTSITVLIEWRPLTNHNQPTFLTWLSHKHHQQQKMIQILKVKKDPLRHLVAFSNSRSTLQLGQRRVVPSNSSCPRSIRWGIRWVAKNKGLTSATKILTRAKPSPRSRPDLMQVSNICLPGKLLPSRVLWRQLMSSFTSMRRSRSATRCRTSRTSSDGSSTIG